MMLEIQVDYNRSAIMSDTITFVLEESLDVVSKKIADHLNENCLLNSDFRITLRGTVYDFTHTFSIKLCENICFVSYNGALFI